MRMNTQMLMNQMELDFDNLAKEHEITASIERLWVKDSRDAETATMHEENAQDHLLLARMYRRMKGDILAFIETYDDYEFINN